MFVNFEAFNELNANPVFSHAEVQQLREVLREKINDMEGICDTLSYNANYYKSDLPGLSKFYWRDHFKTRAKIKKLAALQTKLKSFDVLY